MLNTMITQANRTCVRIGILGLLFGFMSVSYAQDPLGITSVDSSTININDVLNLAKTLGWPITFGYMLYTTGEKLLKEWAADLDRIAKDVHAIRRYLIKEKGDDMDL